MFVKSLHIYPVKSLGGLSLDEVELEARGPKNDRRFMIVHADGEREGKFVTQRYKGAEKLAIVRPSFHGSVLNLAFPDGQSCDVIPPEPEAEILIRKLFSHDMEVQDCGEGAARVLSDFLGISVRLMYQPDFVNRQADPKFAKHGDTTSLADGFSLLVTNQRSLEELNKHIAPEKQVNMARFRPNIILDGLEPFEEESVKSLRIGDVELEMVKPCTRCQVPNVNQETGEVANDEPGATLRKLRFGSDKEMGLTGMFFGMNAQPRKLGRLSVGDEVEILEKRTPFSAVQQVKLGYN